jgi:hypothetical protein
MVDIDLNDSIASSKVGIKMPIFHVRVATPTSQVDLPGDCSRKSLTVKGSEP